MEEREVTESYKGNDYEGEFTKDFFITKRNLVYVQSVPVVENLKVAFANVKGISYALIHSVFYMKQFKEKVKPVLDEIEKILYGNHDNPAIKNLCSKYGVSVHKDPRGKKSIVFDNSQNLLNELWEIFYLVKQWAYREGFFAKKPFERRYGKAAMEDAFIM